LTRIPEDSHGKPDYSFHAVNSLFEVAENKGWKVTVKCNPNIHVKFIVIDDSTCLFTTSNPTDAGIYYNIEAMVILRQSHAKTFSELFFKAWERAENVNFEHLRTFHGYDAIGIRSDAKDIAEKAVSFCMKNGNCKIPKWQVCKEITRLGFDENAVITVLRNLVRDGVLYEPDDNHYHIV
jgi:hypothetical protein